MDLDYKALEKWGEYFVSLLMWRQNNSKLCSKNFAGGLTFYYYPRKIQIYRWVHNFQTIGSVNSHSKKVENPKSGRKLTARYPDNVDAVSVSVGKSPNKSFRRHFWELRLSRESVSISKKNKQLNPYRFQIKYNFTPAYMEKNTSN